MKNSLDSKVALKESKKQKCDIVHPYIYLQDLDGKEIPSWNFLSRIATAENVEDNVIYGCAVDNGYKIFVLEAPGITREIVAAKEVKAEDIEKEYGDFLQGKAFVHEVEFEIKK